MSATSSRGRPRVVTTIAGSAEDGPFGSIQEIEWALNALKVAGADFGVTHGHAQVQMTEKDLNNSEVDARFQEMRCEAVTQHVRGDSFVEAGSLRGATHRLTHGSWMEVAFG